MRSSKKRAPFPRATGPAGTTPRRGDVWDIDLDVVAIEFTRVGVNPALDAFTGVACSLTTVLRFGSRFSRVRT